jgi:cell division protein FtsB
LLKLKKENSALEEEITKLKNKIEMKENYSRENTYLDKEIQCSFEFVQLEDNLDEIFDF